MATYVWLVKTIRYLLLLLPLLARAQADQQPGMSRYSAAIPSQATELRGYENAEYGFSLRYAADVWQLVAQPEVGVVQFVAGRKKKPEAQLTISVIPLPEALRGMSLAQQLDSLKASLRRKRLYEYNLLDTSVGWKLPPYTGITCNYYYSRPFQGRVHHVGLVIRRGSNTYVVEYSGNDKADALFKPSGLEILISFAFQPLPHPVYEYVPAECDDKIYGVVSYDPTQGEQDDRQSLHEFPGGIISRANVVWHRNAFPFQTVALAKGFNNNLYAVPHISSEEPLFVYCYNPATRQGDYTPWQLPAYRSDEKWISGGTDRDGNLLFMTGDVGLLVRLDPRTGAVSTVWDHPPAANFKFDEGFGIRISNFCLDDQGTAYLIRTTDGAVFRVDMATRRAWKTPPVECPLPFVSGGIGRHMPYADILVQPAVAGQPNVYVSGEGQTFALDLRTRRATALINCFYSDLAGCSIFRSRLPQTVWQGRILDDSTRQPLPQALLLPAAPTPAVRVDASAAFAWRAAPGRTYAYEVRQPGYYTVVGTWAAATAGRQQNVLLKRIRVGSTMLLENVQFQQGKAVLLPGAEAALRKLVMLLREQPTMTIELAGHTDNVGPAEKNQQLSQGRVEVVKAYLVRQGVAAGRISGRGYGGTRPKASNAQEATRRLNRRVEFTITGLD